MGDNSKALSSHEKALQVWQQSLPPNHPDLVGSYNSIGLVHFSMGNYSKSCIFYEHAVQIEQQLLPSNQPELQK
ncbi:unnamed protein product [Adineta steineri]|uniref:Uncharacterized protein n=1 Tax=Adineta steineri TaxID=433720 RepID=A0A819D4W9_9BILA|nr:unnamed protein product [Adineta steineri]CAF3829707.1 unnamed protein product [Adineta steineri]